MATDTDEFVEALRESAASDDLLLNMVGLAERKVRGNAKEQLVKKKVWAFYCSALNPALCDDGLFTAAVLKECISKTPAAKLAPLQLKYRGMVQQKLHQQEGRHERPNIHWVGMVKCKQGIGRARSKQLDIFLVKSHFFALELETDSLSLLVPSADQLSAVKNWLLSQLRNGKVTDSVALGVTPTQVEAAMTRSYELLRTDLMRTPSGHKDFLVMWTFITGQRLLETLVRTQVFTDIANAADVSPPQLLADVLQEFDFDAPGLNGPADNDNNPADNDNNPADNDNNPADNDNEPADNDNKPAITQLDNIGNHDVFENNTELAIDGLEALVPGAFIANAADVSQQLFADVLQDFDFDAHELNWPELAIDGPEALVPGAFTDIANAADVSPHADVLHECGFDELSELIDGAEASVLDAPAPQKRKSSGEQPTPMKRIARSPDLFCAGAWNVSAWSESDGLEKSERPKLGTQPASEHDTLRPLRQTQLLSH